MRIQTFLQDLFEENAFFSHSSEHKPHAIAASWNVHQTIGYNLVYYFLFETEENVTLYAQLAKLK